MLNKKKIQLSICIPTYNRPKYLHNCLESILQSKKNCKGFNFEACISDNSTNTDTKKIVMKYKKKLRILYKKNVKNIGYPKNYIKVVNYAKGKFVWVIGDDEILKINCLSVFKNIISKNNDIDFIYLNSNTLHSEYLKKFSHPFNTKNLPKKINKFSNINKNEKINFFDLVDHKIAWDFMLGIFTCAYNRKMFINELKKIDKRNVYKKGYWTTFDNTAFYIKVYSKAFKNSKAYLQSMPLVVSTYGHKEWGKLYAFIKIVRIPELLDVYRMNGLKFKNYLIQKNYALKDFFSCFYYIFKNGDEYGKSNVKIYDNILKNLFFPSIYIQLIKLLFIKILNQLLNKS